jgi:hypothetical protein
MVSTIPLNIRDNLIFFLLNVNINAICFQVKDRKQPAQLTLYSALQNFAQALLSLSTDSSIILAPVYLGALRIGLIFRV